LLTAFWIVARASTDRSRRHKWVLVVCNFVLDTSLESVRAQYHDVPVNLQTARTRDRSMFSTETTEFGALSRRYRLFSLALKYYMPPRRQKFIECIALVMQRLAHV
jgi:hypothetical protein